MHKNIDIQIIRGNDKVLAYADINIIIDVIRAFTVSHFAFLSGAKRIYLTNSETKALAYKKALPNVLLSGEVKGFKIESFDFGNSPYDMKNIDLNDKTLVQKTTNGVKATLNSLNSDAVFVTGFSNAKSTARYIRERMKDIKKDTISINIIASNESGEDDLACAKYMKSWILSEQNISEEHIAYSIMASHSAQKFLDKKDSEFSILDLLLCSIPHNSDFVMQVKKDKEDIVIEKLSIKGVVDV